MRRATGYSTARVAASSAWVALALLAVLALLAGCAAPAERAAMEATRRVAGTRQPQADVQVVVQGGQETSPVGSPGISDADLQAAIEASLVKSGIFRSAKPAQAHYTLVARIVDLSRPSIGFSFTVSLELAWTLTRSSDGQVLLRKAIRTEHTTGALESFAAVTRLRMAVEGAARKNIDETVRLLGELNPGPP